jgi:hypothetical protein
MGFQKCPNQKKAGGFGDFSHKQPAHRHIKIPSKDQAALLALVL